MEPDRDAAISVGIACSGGGIRSACFTLGALSQFMREGIFAAAPTQLTAVSGGSFAATAFLVTSATSDIADDEPSPWAIDSPEMRELRRRCDYLASGTREQIWLILASVRSAIINLSTVWLLALVLGHAFGLAVGWGSRRPPGYAVAALALPAAIMFVASVALLLQNSRPSRVEGRAVKDDRIAKWSVYAAAVSAAGVVLCVALPRSLDQLHNIVGHRLPEPLTVVWWIFPSRGAKAVVFLLVSLVAAASGFVAVTLAFPRPWRRRLRGLSSIILSAAILFGPFLWSFDGALSAPVARVLLALLVELVAVLLFTALFEANWYSLFPNYRASLRATFFWRRQSGSLGVTAFAADGEPKELSRMTLSDLLAAVETKAKADQRGRYGLHPGTSLRVVGSVNLNDRSSFTGAEVEQFVFGAMCGSPSLKSHPARPYESTALGASMPLDLGSIVAISGAAITPTMGRLTQRGMTVLLALLNLRLGVWLQNPAFEGAPRRWARPNAGHVLLEAFARTRGEGRFVFVSDGGHFDNLGLLVAASEGCDILVSLDASLEAPGETTAFAHSLGLLRSRGYDYTLDAEPARSEPGVLATPVTRGWIISPTGARIRLFHLRCERFAEMKPDLRGVAARHRQFPRHPTLQQFFTSDLLDAYYLLGHDVAQIARVGERVTPATPPIADGFWS